VTALLRFGSSTLSALLLVAVNLIPLIGVAFWGWSLMLILVLYWVESGIVGAINVMKIAAARGVGLGIGGRGITIRINGFAGGLARGALIGFFIFHYGMFWVVHGVFVFLLPVFAGMSSMPTAPSRRPTSVRCRSTGWRSRHCRWPSATWSATSPTTSGAGSPCASRRRSR
jgi:hypothetical protein